jgi:hypothetical protein
MIRITLKIKSRAFGVTFGTFSKTFEVQVGVPLPRLDRVLMDERGVFLSISA